MKKQLFLVVTMWSILTNVLFAQSVSDHQAKRHFSITSLYINDRKVETFGFLFRIDGREIPAERDGDAIFVPDEVVQTTWEKSGFRITTNEHDLIFDKLLIRGYSEDDPVKVDYEIRAEFRPSEINARHIRRLSQKEKRSLAIKSAEDVCSVYTLKPSNVVISEPELIADPVITKRFNLRRGFASMCN